MKITRINMGASNSYLIPAKKGYILIDAGISKKSKTLKRALKKLNAEPEDIKLIIITHAHHDHVGSLHEIKRLSKAPVLLHQKEKTSLEKGYTEFPKGTDPITRTISTLIDKFSRKKQQFTPVKPDMTIKDDYDLKNFGMEGKIIHTPGHTRGSICMIIQNKYCFTGDTLFNIFNNIYPPLADDENILRKSLEKIKSYNCRWYYPGHGKVFDKKTFEKMIDKKLNFHKKNLAR